MSLWDLFTHIVQSSKTLDFELKWYVSSLLDQNNWVLRDRISQQNVWICWLPTSISVNLVQMILFACNFECYRVTWIVSWPFSICFLKGLVFVLFRQWHFFVQSDLQYLLVLRNWHQIGSRVLSLSPFFHPIHWLFAYIRCYLYELIKFKLVKCF